MNHRITIIILLYSLCAGLYSQKLVPNFVSLSYYGESVLHPGIKVGAGYTLVEWEITQIKNRQHKFQVYKRIEGWVSTGFYYHNGYQSGQFLIPEIQYQRQKLGKTFAGLGLGLGIIRTSIVNVFQINTSHTIEKARIAAWNAAIVLSSEFEKKLPKYPVAIYIKPQLMVSIPDFTKYLTIEVGCIYMINYEKYILRM